MPLSTDSKTNDVAGNLLQTFHAIFGNNPGFRPAHAKGTLVTGTFTPTPEASTLSSAPHFKSPTPITARFSNSTGFPNLPDNDPNAVPHGLGLRFHLGGRSHTDIITHSTPFFPVKTGEDFLGLLKAQIATGSPEAQGVSPSPIEEFLGSHPETYKFVTAPKPQKESLVSLDYFGVNAFKFINDDKKETFVRYQILHVVDTPVINGDDLKSKGPNFLFEELPQRLTSGSVDLKLVVQIAEEGDVINDATVHWPEDRKIVELGTITLEKEEEEAKNKADQKYIIFDPIPRVEGIEPSDDPILDFRASLYLLSGRERRAA